AGAIVMDVLASNGGRLPHEKIERIRSLRPDMILLSGGTDGGTVTHVVEMAEYIAAADPRPRLGMSYKRPLIDTGNKDARDRIKEILGEKTSLVITDNIRPVLERENLGPSRNKIHDLFLEHVMAQAPGYKKLIEWTGAPIMPTPAAVGLIMETIAKREHLNLIGVAIAREALRLALAHHKSLATGLKGVQQERSISDIFEQRASGQTLIDMRKLDLIVGSGGILSHSPRRVQSMVMMVDAYEPLGFTQLSVDSIF